jgi:hypothetical protein
MGGETGGLSDTQRPARFARFSGTSRDDQAGASGGRESRLFPHPIQSMTTPYTPLNEDELNELDQFLLYDVDTEDVMTLDMVDGFLHALAVGPATIPPKQWLPKIWGTRR